MKIVISEVKITGFRGYIETVTFNLSDYTRVTGDNGLGKSTLSEAITWCFYGCSLTGNDKYDSFLLNKNSTTMSVEINFSIDGVEHNLLRKRSKTASIYLDGTKHTQQDIIFELSKSCRIPLTKEIFLSIFLPNFFLKKDSKEMKEVLTKILPKIDRVDVLSQLDSPFKEIVAAETNKNNNQLLSELKSEKEEFENDILYQEGAIDKKEKDLSIMVIPESKNFNSEELNQLKAELEALTLLKPKVIDLSDLYPQKALLDKEILELSLKKPDLEDNLIITNELNDIRAQYKVLKSQLITDCSEGNICPTCNQVITLEHVESVNTDINKQLAQLEDIAKDYNSILDGIKTQNEEITKTFNEGIEAEKAMLLEQIEMLGFNSIIEENAKTKKVFDEEISKNKSLLNAKITALENAKDIITKSNTERDLLIKMKSNGEADIIKMKQAVIDTRNKIKNLDDRIAAAGKYNAKYAEALSNQIKPYLNCVTINLVKCVKLTGELKDCFEILYDNKEYNLLSLSETFKAGIEISNLIMNVTDIFLPVFADNKESITFYNKPNTQIIEAEVVKNESLQVINVA